MQVRTNGPNVRGIDDKIVRMITNTENGVCDTNIAKVKVVESVRNEICAIEDWTVGSVSIMFGRNRQTLKKMRESIAEQSFLT